MGLFDFFKSSAKKPSIDLTDYKFLSDDHTRIENGVSVSADNKGAWRGIRIKTSDNKTFYVTMYNMNGNHPVWGDNIQMAEKQMKLISEDSEKIILRGYGEDALGSSFADYGITLHKTNSNVDKITLHMLDRNIDIIYLRGNTETMNKTLLDTTDAYERKIINGKEFAVKIKKVQELTLTLAGVVSSHNKDYVEFLSYRPSQLFRGDYVRQSIVCKIDEYIEELDFLTDCLIRMGISDEGLINAFLALTNRHITQYSRIIDNDLYAYIDKTLIVRQAILVKYNQEESNETTQKSWIVFLRYFMEKFGNFLYITEYDENNKPYLKQHKTNNNDESSKTIDINKDKLKICHKLIELLIEEWDDGDARISQKVFIHEVNCSIPELNLDSEKITEILNLINSIFPTEIIVSRFETEDFDGDSLWILITRSKKSSLNIVLEKLKSLM